MRRKGQFLFLTLYFCCVVPAFAEQLQEPPRLFSPYTAETFYEIGYDLYTAPNAKLLQNKEAIVFLGAAMDVGEQPDYILPDIIELLSKFPEEDYTAAMYSSLIKYAGEKSDLQVARTAVRYLLESYDAREQREALLQSVLQELGGKNPALSSELNTQLALLVAEKADINTAASLLTQAYQDNPYNKLAFAKLDEVSAEPLSVVAYVRHLRLALRENPLSLENCLKFAHSVESLGLYNVAADAYAYCADLFAYLYPSQPLPPSMYLPWALTCFNTEARQHKCLEIADRIRGTGGFDVLLQAIAARAALKLGYQPQANEIFKAVGDRAARAVSAKPPVSVADAEQFAWFYCFAMPDAEKALLWANKSYAAAPESPSVMAILAYALVMNEQHQLARPLVAQSYNHNQIAAITMGLIELKQQNKIRAVEALKSAVAVDPGSLEAQYAEQVLQENGSGYVPIVETAPVLEGLTNEFGSAIVPKFAAPAKMLSVELTTNSGTGFSYGSKTSGELVIYNHWFEHLVISDDGLIKGNIRVDAELSGDLNLEIPNLIVKKIQPPLPINPGRATIISLRFFVGRLKESLLNSPQADLQLKFTAYLDPVATADGQVRNAIADIPPASLTMRRKPVTLTNRYLQDRLDYLSKGNQGQKIKSAILFTGLLLEQKAMVGSDPLYRFMYQEPALLKSAVLRALADQDWMVKLQTMAAIVNLPLDYDITNAVAANLYDSDWPVRMMAVFLLARSQGPDFKNVLDATAKSDEHIYVRRMAIAFGAEVPEEEQKAPPAEPAEATESAGETPAAPDQQEQQGGS